jgi:predicted lipoprotein with Yx(FWY)xxD motif
MHETRLAQFLRSRLGPALVALPLALAAFGAAAAPAMVRNGALVDPKGMTLYTFDSDPAGASKSECNGPCAQNWPPLAATTADESKGNWKVITRADGTYQWTYKGKPLYRWKSDQRPGDHGGDGLKGVWHIAKH